VLCNNIKILIINFNLNTVLIYLVYFFYSTGKVIDGLLILRKIENVPTGPNNKPKIAVVITQCGEM
jgi:hypothetical protein